MVGLPQRTHGFEAAVNDVAHDNFKRVRAPLTLYAWKISAVDKADVESITTLDQLKAYLDASDLPRAEPCETIIARTRLMQHEGQGVYKHRLEGEEWTLLSCALG
jgi:hypothetical protein